MLTLIEVGLTAKMAIHDFAIADFSKAIELDPDYVDGYNNRGISYL